MKTRKILFAAITAMSVMFFYACEEDACEDVDCGLYGTCVDGDCVCDTGYDGATCNTCATGYEGYPDCVAANEKVLGNYTVNSTCLGVSYTSAATPVSGEPAQVTFSNFGNTNGLNVNASVSGTTVTIISGDYDDADGDTWTMSGSGTFNSTNSTITMNTTYVFEGGSPNTCTETFTLNP